MRKIDIREENELLASISQGDRQAFRQVFEQYFEYLVSTVYQLSGNVELGRDVAQEVFLDIWRKRSQIHVRSSLKSYLRRAAINRMLDKFRANKHYFTDLEDAPEIVAQTVSPQQQLEEQDLQTLVQQTVNQLPEKCRLVFVLSRYEGFSHKEIAQQLDISPKTIENQITKALKLLRQAIQTHNHEASS